MNGDDILKLLHEIEGRLDRKLDRIEGKVDLMNGRVRTLEKWKLQTQAVAKALAGNARMRQAHTYKWWTLAALLAGVGIGAANTISNVLGQLVGIH